MVETEGWPAYLRRAMESAGYDKAADLARDSGVGEVQLSRWLRGANVPDVDNLRKLVRPLRIPMLELMVAAGHLSPAEARMRDRPTPPPPPSRDAFQDLLDDLSDDEARVLRGAIAGTLAGLRDEDAPPAPPVQRRATG